MRITLEWQLFLWKVEYENQISFRPRGELITQARAISRSGSTSRDALWFTYPSFLCEHELGPLFREQTRESRHWAPLGE